MYFRVHLFFFLWRRPVTYNRNHLDMPCDSYWGWLSWFHRTLSHFISFTNRNHWPQFESCLKSSSDHGTICIKLDLVECEKVFQHKGNTRGNTFPVWNGYCKPVITSTAESKRFFFFFFKPQTALRKWRLTSNVVSAFNLSGTYIYIYIYIYIYVILFIPCPVAKAAW